MKLHGRWLIRCRNYVLLYWSVEANEFLVYICMYVCMYMYIELCYKAPVSNTFVMSSIVCYFKYSIELCYKASISIMFYFSILLVISVREHQGQCSYKGVG